MLEECSHEVLVANWASCRGQRHTTNVSAVCVIQCEVIGCEERYLECIFGEEYLAYKARVSRWV